jgi:hypothetical protein
MNKRSLLPVFFISLLLVLSGCTPKHFLIPSYEQKKPARILVLPPMNKTPQEGVENFLYPIFTRAIGEKGYYVYSPEFVREIFNQNKLEDAGRIYDLPYDKITSVFHPDAILYITVEQWAGQYYLIGNTITTTILARLIDARTGEELFNMRYTHKYDPSAGQSSLVGKVVMALVTAMAEKSYLEPAARANTTVIAKYVPRGKYDDKW